MRRVGNNDICFWDILHHTALGRFAHPGPLPAFDLRISLRILELLAYLLLRHLHLFIKTMLLVCPVQNTYDQIHQTDPQSRIYNDRSAEHNCL